MSDYSDEICLNLIIDNTKMLSVDNKKGIIPRALLVGVAALSVGLAMALISIAKFVLFVGGLIYFIWQHLSARSSANLQVAAAPPNTPVPQNTARVILIALAAFTASLLWTSADTSDALGSVAKYGKLLSILLIPLLLKTRQEAMYAACVFVLGQLFLVTSSWMLFFGLPVPWATSQTAVTEFAVFSTYLDQGVMSAAAAAVCWHLRKVAPGRFGNQIAIGVALLCIVNVLFVLKGRSGHVVAIALLSLAVMWELPRRLRWFVVVMPVALLAVLFLTSPKVNSRVTEVVSEVHSFSFKEGTTLSTGTSSGIRLHFWSRSIQSITDNPLLGAGVGSWSTEFDRIEKIHDSKAADVNKRGNPHQEYLLWGVQLGVPGIALLLAFFAAVYIDSRRADSGPARATQSVLAALAVACLFNSPIYDALIGDFFCVALGLMLALAAYKEPTSAYSSRPA